MAALRLRPGSQESPAENSQGGLRSGWEAGIRTPITWSRATCPTVGRPPSTSRGAPTTRTIDYSQSKIGSANRRWHWGSDVARAPTRRWRRRSARRQGSPRRRRPTAPAYADGSPSHPCGRLRALPRSSTRGLCLFDALLFHPCWQSPAACSDPSTRIRDLL